jgi:hypothetical protein
MTDSVNDGIAEKANSGNSESETNQKGSSETDAVTKAEFEKLASQIETLRRSLQSEKDKAVKQTNERLTSLEGDVREVLQSAKKQGKSVDELLEDYEQEEELRVRNDLRELTRAFKEGRLSPQAPGKSQDSGVDVSGVLKELELDSEDIRVKEFSSRKFATEAEAFKEGAKLLKTIVSNQPTDADIPSKVAQRQSSPDAQARLMAEYKEGSKNMRGQQLIQFKKQMRAKGLEIT